MAGGVVSRDQEYVSAFSLCGGFWYFEVCPGGLGKVGFVVVYCTNCGKQNSNSAKFCRYCGVSLAPVIASHSAPTLPYRVDPYSDPNARDYGWENSSEVLRRRRVARWESSESLGMFLSCVGVVAFVHALSLLLPGLERLLDGPLMWLLVAGMAAGYLFKLIWDRRLGISVTRSLVEIIVVGAVVYGFMYGSVWVAKNYVFTSGNVGSLIPSILPKTPTAGTEAGLEVKGTVSTAGLFMREGPGREYPEVKAYAEGDVVKVVGKEPGQGWVKVMAPDGRSGWMSVRFLRLSAGLERVPVVDVPPLPTPTKGDGGLKELAV